MAASDSDWRLMGQENYLLDATLCWRPYDTAVTGTDHDHCEFCSVTFAESGLIPEALHAGYSTVDAYRWICEGCFADFNERFRWTLIECEG